MFVEEKNEQIEKIYIHNQLFGQFEFGEELL